ncbi:hypothetical protein [Paraburkholderia dilworthii]|uniref:Phage protein n=1 Tax=Paraburkholderia dilworthii TaxID=948106 RepID=A0ABW9D990_9BURK
MNKQNDNSASVAAIQFALEADEGMEWLSLWNEGSFDSCRREWPEAPQECYVGADPLMPETKALLAAQTSQQGISDAARDVLAERRRHVEVEGWAQEHDDQHNAGMLAVSAACYALHAAAGLSSTDSAYWSRTFAKTAGELWQFDVEWWKPSTTRRDLVKAGALILAEIERLDRDPGDESGNHHTNGGDHA